MTGWVVAVLLAGAPVAKGKPDAGPPLTTQGSSDAMEQRALDQAWDQMRALMGPDGGFNQTHPPFQWKLSNIIDDIEMPGTVISNGFPVKMHAFRVKGSEEAIFRELMDNFQEQGLWMQTPTKQPQPLRQNQLTALDTDRRISYTAFVEPHPDGTCTVMLGEANIGLGLDAAKQGGQVDFAPLYPGCDGVMRSQAEGMDSLSFRTTDGEAKVLEFYRKRMKELGYSEAAGNGYIKPGEHIRIVGRRSEGGTLTVLLVRTRGELAPPQ